MRNNGPAGFFVRLAAFIVDSLLLSFMVLVFKVASLLPGSIFQTKILFEFTFSAVISYILVSLYFIVLTYFNGQTIGKMLFGIKVISTDKESLTFMQVLLRETFCKYISSFIMYLGYIMIGPDEKKRGLHDRICDTQVVYTAKKGFYEKNQF